MALMEKIAQCLSPTSTIPTDVRFLFNKGSSTKELKAHKLILALISDVFEREFYGSMKDGKDDIDIKDASHDVFQAMIDFIYNKHSDLKVYDLTFLSQLYYLGEKYNIEDLRNRIIAAIPEFKILDENVLDVAILAEEYILHEPLMEALYKAATCFLWRKFAGQLSLVIDFFSQIEVTEVHGVVLMKMMARMKKLPPAPSKCENCNTIPCLNGVGLTSENFVAGARMLPKSGGLSNIDKLINIGGSRPNRFTGSLTDGSVAEFLTFRYYAYKCC